MHENLGYIFTEREKSAEIEVEFTGEKQEIAVGKDLSYENEKIISLEI